MLYLAILGLFAGTSALAFIYRKEIYVILMNVRYEAIYWILGGVATGHDIIFSWCNKLKERPQRKGDVAIVTGGARGMGREVVKILLECDMTVVIACRKVENGVIVKDYMRNLGVKTGQVDVMQLDVASSTSVKNFAKNFLAKYSKLHILVNNAGIMFVPFKLTEDGFENHLATNYMGHALLTHLLLPALVAGGAERDYHARIVNVSSCAHIPGKINFEDINCEKSLYIPSEMYAQSKLAQIMFTKAVERRLREKKVPVSVFSLHPGVVDTELFDGTFLKKVAPWIISLFFKRPEDGAVSIAYVAISSNIENKGGMYLANCRELWVSRTAADENQQEKLMKLTGSLLKVNNFCEVLH